MAGQPKPAFYAAVAAVVIALIAFAVYRSDLFAPKAPTQPGGPIDFKATTVTFTVGGSSVTASPEGLLIKASTIKISGTTKQSKATGHL